MEWAEENFGPESKVTKIIKDRGRWWTDIFQIYARWSVAEHADASLAITHAGGVDVEDLVPFTQPGR